MNGDLQVDGRPVEAGAVARFAASLALVASAAAAAIIPLLYAPPLEAPFIVPKLAALQVAAAVGFLAFALARASAPGVRLVARPVAWGTALVLGSTLASWAVAARAGAANPYALVAIARWLSLFGLASGAVVVARDAAARRTLLEAAVLGAVIVSVLGLWQHLEITSLPIPVISSPGSTFGNRNFGGETIALALPLGLAALAGAHRREGLGRNTWLIAGALLLELLYLAATRTRGAWLGAATGVASFLAVWRPRLSRRALGVASAALLLAAVAAIIPGPSNPWNINDTKRYASGVQIAESSFDPQSPAIHTRIGIWRRSLAMWRDNPVWGVGPGNWMIQFPRYAEPGARQDGVLTSAVVARQAHDDFLERGGETGVVGVLTLLALAAGVVAAARRRARASDADVRVTTAAGAGTLAALVGCGITGFPLEMPGTLALAGIGLGLVAAINEAPEAAPSARAGRGLVSRWLVVAVAGATVMAAAVTAQREVRASYWLEVGIRALRHDYGPGGGYVALPALARARALDPRSYHVWLRVAHAEMRVGHAKEATAAARHALDIEPWAPNARAVLASAQLLGGDPIAAHESARWALTVLRDMPHALMIEAQAMASLGDPIASAAARERLRSLATTPSPDRKTRNMADELLTDLEGRKLKPEADEARALDR